MLQLFQSGVMRLKTMQSPEPHSADVRLAEAAVDQIEAGSSVAIGAGNVCDLVIEAMRARGISVDSVVPCSGAKKEKLKQCGLPVASLNDLHHVDLYIGTADQVTRDGCFIHCSTGFFTQEKIIAGAARKVLCLVTADRMVDQLGGIAIAVPLEVLSIARMRAIRKLRFLGATAMQRARYRTAHGNIILDAVNLGLRSPHEIELALRTIPGIVESGLFAQRCADVIVTAKGKRQQVLNVTKTCAP